TLSGIDTRLAVIAVNTMLASAAGAASGCVYSWRRFEKPDVTMMCNGMLGGLVSITAPCAFVASWAAVLIGLCAGVIVVEASLWVEQRLRIDDPVGAISVHGVCGAFGVISLGIFADGSYGEGLNGVPGNVTGLLYGDPGQLLAALVGVGVNLMWVGTSAALTFMLIDRLVGNRVSREAELRGLDLSEMGMEGYFNADAPVAAAISGGRDPLAQSSSKLPSAAQLWVAPQPHRR
ncbi:MAG TPA: hypothetical protein VHZ95_17675, partial [Polyangiales bacterium]|nr:hypothetical protein [Polyangiales bacterium]